LNSQVAADRAALFLIPSRLKKGKTVREFDLSGLVRRLWVIRIARILEIDPATNDDEHQRGDQNHGTP